MPVGFDYYTGNLHNKLISKLNCTEKIINTQVKVEECLFRGSKCVI
jgi:hypothetical protein